MSAVNTSKVVDVVTTAAALAASAASQLLATVNSSANVLSDKKTITSSKQRSIGKRKRRRLVRRRKRRFSSSTDNSLTFASPVVSGSASSPSGTLVLDAPHHSYDSKRLVLSDYPHTCYVRYYLCTPSISSMGNIGYIDKTYSVSSKDASHLSWMYVALSRSDELWQKHASGNSTLVGVDCLITENTSSSTVNQGKSCMVQMDRIPVSSSHLIKVGTFAGHKHGLDMHDHVATGLDPHHHLMDADFFNTHHHPINQDMADPLVVIWNTALEENHVHGLPGADPSVTGLTGLWPKGLTDVGVAPTGIQTKDTTLDYKIEKNTAPIETKSATASASVVPYIEYVMPSHVISGINIDLTFNSASVADQWFTIKLCRVVGPTNRALDAKLDVAHTQILVNSLTSTDSRYFETLWQHSFFMPRMTTFKSLKNRSVHIQKKIRCKYNRSLIRSLPHSIYVQDYGSMLNPFDYPDPSGRMYNGLSLFFGSRVVDEQYVANKLSAQAGSLTSGITTMATVHQRESAVISTLSVAKGYAKFGVSGIVQENFAIKDYFHRHTKIGD